MFFGGRHGGHHKDSLTGLEILVLTIVKNKGSISGYDIIQKIDKSFSDLWKASAGTIYPLLNRLLKKGLVIIEEITEDARPKKLYKITKKGEEALRKVLTEELEPSIQSIGDFINQIFKTIPIKDTLEESYCWFPFHDYGHKKEKVDKSDYSLKNIRKIRMIIDRLKHVKTKIQSRVDNLEKRIKYYQEILEELQKKREKNVKTIDIVEDDDEFENF
jgi:DNA-binding PadR family transcriptional regulator